MNTNANNNIKEEPLFQPQYEYQGKENYSPTSGFLKKIYLVLDVQLAIVLALHLILGVLSIQTDNLFFDIFTIIVRSCFFIIVALILIFQMASARNLKTSPISTFILFTIRTLLLYSILRAYFFLSIKQVTLFISLILSLYLTFTAYMFCLGTTYRRKIAFIWLMSFIVTATGFLYLLKEVLIPGIFSHLAILLNVFLTFLYGLYLIYETGFILDGVIYQINHHEYLFGALILQFDLIGMAFWIVKKCKKNPRSRN